MVPILILIAVEYGSVFASRMKMRTLCEAQQHPVIQNAGAWRRWSALVRARTETVADRDKSHRINELAASFGMSMRVTMGHKYGFPFDGVHVVRRELRLHGRPIASIDDMIAHDLGPIQRALLGDVGGSRGCSSARLETLVSLTEREFNLPALSSDWRGHTLD